MFRLPIYIIGILSFCLTKGVYSENLNVTDDTRLHVLAYEMCPYTSFCSSGNNSAPEGYYSCCEECFCSDDCHLTNRCCPDAEIRNTDTDLTTCKYQFEYFDVHRNIFYEAKYPTYLTVSTCADNEVTEEIVNGCLQPSALEDHVLVSDKKSSTIYKNAKCAECNGIQNYETWDLLGFCPFDESLLNFDRRTNYALEHCSFVSRPPKNTADVHKPFRCSPDVIGVCNVTKEWDFYDEVLERACGKYNMMYKDEHVVLGNFVKTYRIYKNVYCYLCNNKRGTEPNDVCLLDLEVEKSTPTMFAPFTAIFESDKSTTLKTDGGKCAIDEIEDPLTDACTHLYCPFGEAPIHGSCVVIMRETSVSLSAIYKLDIHVTTSKTNHQHQDFSTRVFQTIVNDIQTKFSQTGCELCDIFMFTEYTILIRAKPSTICPMSRLLKVYKYMAQLKISSKTLMNIELKQTNNFTLVVPRNGAVSIKGLERLHQFNGRICRVGIHLTTKFFCKRVTYSKTDLAVNGVSDDTIKKLLALSDPYEKDEDSLDKHLICLSDYKRIKNVSPKIVFWTPLILVWLIVMASI